MYLLYLYTNRYDLMIIPICLHYTLFATKSDEEPILVIILPHAYTALLSINRATRSSNAACSRHKLQMFFTQRAGFSYAKSVSLYKQRV